MSLDCAPSHITKTSYPAASALASRIGSGHALIVRDTGILLAPGYVSRVSVEGDDLTLPVNSCAGSYFNDVSTITHLSKLCSEVEFPHTLIVLATKLSYTKDTFTLVSRHYEATFSTHIKTIILAMESDDDSLLYYYHVHVSSSEDGVMEKCDLRDLVFKLSNLMGNSPCLVLVHPGFNYAILDLRAPSGSYWSVSCTVNNSVKGAGDEDIVCRLHSIYLHPSLHYHRVILKSEVCMDVVTPVRDIYALRYFTEFVRGSPCTSGKCFDCACLEFMGSYSNKYIGNMLLNRAKSVTIPASEVEEVITLSQTFSSILSKS
jgi:hypothetical protein